MLLTIEEYENVIIKSINFPIMAGGASTCEFCAKVAIALNSYVTVKEGSTVRFEGYVTRRSRTRDVEHLRVSYDYTAICKSYYEYSQNDVVIDGYGDNDDSFSGNGVSYQEWLYRENANYHVLWPPKDADPIVWDDQDTAVALPPNHISIEDVEENDLPSHVKVDVHKYREKRFPVLADFFYYTDDKLPTSTELRTVAKFANYGRQYKIMNPANPTQQFSEKLLKGAKVGGSKFFIKGHASLDTPKKENKVFSASVNRKRHKKTLTKKGEGGSPDTPGTETAKYNFCRINMVFNLEKSLVLPRVTGAHGTGTDQQQCYVRCRYLEEIKTYSQALGGANKQDKLASVEHCEIEVSYDTFDGTNYRDWTFGGCPGLLHADNDQGNGIWSADLSGTYIEQEGIERGQVLLGKAAQHYDTLKYTTSVVLAGIVWNYNKKVIVDEKDVVLDQITWNFGLRPAENRTNYEGVKLLDGFSFPLYKKKQAIAKQEKRSKTEKAVDPETHKGADDGIHQVAEYCRICWNISSTADLSEGEFFYRKADGSWESKKKLCWIDFETSVNITIDTAGDNTIFEVSFYKSDITRNVPGVGDVTRDLYSVWNVADDKGNTISHVKTVEKDSTNARVFGYLIDEQRYPTWSYDSWWYNLYANPDTSAAYIYTNIWNETTSSYDSKKNKVAAYIDKEWDLSGSEDYYLLVRNRTKAIQFHFLPVKPVLQDAATKVWESAWKISGVSSTPIATYKRLI